MSAVEDNAPGSLPDPIAPDPGPGHEPPVQHVKQELTAPVPRSRLPWYLQRNWVLSFLLAVVVHLPLTPAGSFFRIAKTLIFPDKSPPSAEASAKPPEQDLTLPFEMIEDPTAQAQKDGENAVELPANPANPSGQHGAILGSPPTPVQAKEAEKAAELERIKSEAAKKVAEKAAEKEKDEHGATARLATNDGTTDGKEETGDGDGTATAKKGQLGLHGDAKDRMIGKPDASLVMWFEPWRQHPTKASLEALFACNTLWKPFLSEGLTPLKDLEGVMMSTSNIAKSSAATYAVQYNVDRARVDAAIASLLKKSGTYGRKLDKDAVQLSLWGRYVVAFPHTRDMLFFAPTKGWDEIYKVKDPLFLPASKGRALSFSLENPSNALRTIGAKIPSRIKELRVDVNANVDTSIDLTLDFDDESDESAKNDASEITSTLRQFMFDTVQAAKLAGMAAGVEGDEIKVPSFAFRASGSHLSDTVKLPATQATTLMKTLGYFACSKKPGK